jgi:hypothetical protein
MCCGGDGFIASTGRWLDEKSWIGVELIQLVIICHLLLDFNVRKFGQLGSRRWCRTFMAASFMHRVVSLTGAKFFRGFFRNSLHGYQKRKVSFSTFANGDDMQVGGGRLNAVNSRTQTETESCSWQKEIVTEVSAGSSAEVRERWSCVTCMFE